MEQTSFRVDHSPESYRYSHTDTGTATQQFDKNTEEIKDMYADASPFLIQEQREFTKIPTNFIFNSFLHFIANVEQVTKTQSSQSPEHLKYLEDYIEKHSDVDQLTKKPPIAYMKRVQTQPSFIQPSMKKPQGVVQDLIAFLQQIDSNSE